MLEGPNLKSSTLFFSGIDCRYGYHFAMTNTEIKYGKNFNIQFWIEGVSSFRSQIWFSIRCFCLLFWTTMIRARANEWTFVHPPIAVPLLFPFFRISFTVRISEFSSVCRIACSSIHLCVLWAELQKIWHMFRKSRKSDLNGKHMEKRSTHTHNSNIKWKRSAIPYERHSDLCIT